MGKWIKMKLGLSKAETSIVSLVGLTALLVIEAFTVDLMLPLGVASGIPYVIAVLVSLWLPKQQHILVAAAFCTAFVILGFFLSAPEGELWKILTNRSQAVFAIWVTAVLGCQRKGIEKVLERSRSRFAGILDTSIDAIISVNKARQIIIFNKGAERIFGYEQRKAIGQPLELLFPERFCSAQQNHVFKFFDSAEPPGRGGQPQELVGLRNTKEEFLAETSISKVEFGENQFFTIVLRDISERKHLEAQLIQAQKMEAVGTLAGGIAHDFNNLLTIIEGYADVHEAKVIENEPIREAFKEIKNAADRAAHLTKQLLAFSRRQIIEAKVINLNDLIFDLDKIMRRLIGEDIELVILPASSLGAVKVDPNHLEQVIVNLVVNARDAMLGGGKLIIETANVNLTGKDGEHHSVQISPGDYVMLTVTDNGMGIPKEVKEKIFDPFFTTKEQGKGTGLGLATSYGIIKQNNGFIWVYSEPEVGTTFKIYLPGVKEKLEPLKKKEEPTPLSKGTETLLVAEDDFSLRKLAVQILRRHQYKVLEAETGEEALRITQEHLESPIDLLFTDVVMPQMSGKELVERFRSIQPNAKVIFTSGYTNNSISQYGLTESNVEFLAKPYRVEQLLRKVRDVLDKK